MNRSTTPPAPTMHRFRNKQDLERLFQAELDKFPVVDGRRQLSEFGAIMVRPIGEPKKKLTHIVFPQTALSLPTAGRSLQGHSSRTFPQCVLMADAEKNELYIKVMADWVTEDGLAERKSLILTMNQAYFNCDIWETVPQEHQEELRATGFGPQMTPGQWAEAINRYSKHSHPLSYALNGRFLNARELPIPLNRFGSVGTLDSYYLMPEFIVTTINTNRFVFEGMDTSVKQELIPYEIGSAHIHPQRDFEGFDAELVKRLGEQTVQLTPSAADILDMRVSQSLNSDISLAFTKKDINTTESFLGIIAVNKQGKVTGSRYLDFGNFGSNQELLRMTDLNKRTVKTLGSSNPDIGLVVEHFRYIVSFTKDDFGTKTSSPHVGDTDC